MTQEAMFLNEQIENGGDPDRLSEIGYNDYIQTSGGLEVVKKEWTGDLPIPTVQEEIDALDTGLSDEEYRLVEFGISNAATARKRQKWHGGRES